MPMIRLMQLSCRRRDGSRWNLAARLAALALALVCLLAGADQDQPGTPSSAPSGPATPKLYGGGGLAGRGVAVRPARAAPLTGEELKRWFSGLSSAIALHFIAPAGTNGLNSRIQIDVMPNGFVRDARIEVSSGNPEFDSAVLKALYKATPLPLPQNPWATDSRVSLLFDPGLIGSGSPEPVGQDRYLRTFEDVQHVFDDSNDKFLADFRSHLAASGKIVIALTIAPDGGVTKCRIVESSFVDQDLLNTVLSDVKNLQFGARTGSDWSFDRYPIVYGGAPAASKN